MVTRKNANTLTAAEKEELVNAILAVKAGGKYDQHVVRHATAPWNNIHRSPAFLPWHRQFLLDYEIELQDAAGNPDLALPYWNWAEDQVRPDPATGPVWAGDFMGGNGDPMDGGIVKTGPFSEGKWTIVNSGGAPAGPLRRGFAGFSLPSQADIDNALSVLPFDAAPWNWSSSPSFRTALEGLHNGGHVWVGGSMMAATSPNDPVFFLHHCFVDKLWADWQALHPGELYLPQSGGPAGQNLNDLMERTVSGQVTPADMLDHHALGYRYDTEPAIGLADGAYTLQQKSNGRFMDAHESAGRNFSLVTRPAQNNGTQQWILTSLGDDTYTLQQQSSGRFMDAHESGGIDFAAMTRPQADSDTQRWIIVSLGDDTYTLRQKSSGRFVDAHESGGVDFAVMTRPEANDDTQHWIIKAV